MENSVRMIGLGIMGGAMARNLRAAGWRVVGFDTEEARCAELAGAGIEIAIHAVAVARMAPTLITSLPSASALAATVAAGRCGAAAVRAGGVQHAVAGGQVGGGAGARRGRARGAGLPAVRDGGAGESAGCGRVLQRDTTTIDALRPLFLGFSRAVHDVGAFGNGSRMKFVANLPVAINNVASAEAMVLGMKAGLDPHQLVTLVNSGAAGSRVFELRAPMMATGRYDPPTMRVSTWQKDLAVIAGFAAELGCPTPLFSAT